MYKNSVDVGPFFEVHNFLYNDIGWHSLYQNVQLFIGSKNNILNAAIFNYSLHKVREGYYTENTNTFKHDIQLLHAAASKLTIIVDCED